MSTTSVNGGTAPIDTRLNAALASCIEAAQGGDFPHITMATDYDDILARIEKLSLFSGGCNIDFTFVIAGGIDGGFKTVAEVRPIAEVAFENEWEFGVLDNKEEPDIENIDDMIFELQDQYGGRDQYQYLGGSAFDPDGPRTPIIPNNTQSQEG